MLFDTHETFIQDYFESFLMQLLLGERFLTTTPFEPFRNFCKKWPNHLKVCPISLIFANGS